MADLDDVQDALEETAEVVAPAGAFTFHGLTLTPQKVDAWGLVRLQVARRQQDAGLMLLTLLGDDQTNDVLGLGGLQESDIGELIDALLVAAGVGKG
jgi:hypothetical protein